MCWIKYERHRAVSVEKHADLVGTCVTETLKANPAGALSIRLSIVMPAHSRPKDGVASLAYVAGIHVFLECREQDVDGRDKPGHDG